MKRSYASDVVWKNYLFLSFHSFNHLFSNRRDDDDPEDPENFNSNVSTVLLRFRNKAWEQSYTEEPDFMLKYSVLMCFIVFIGIIIVQSLNSPYGLDAFQTPRCPPLTVSTISTETEPSIGRSTELCFLFYFSFWQPSGSRNCGCF